MKKTIFLHIGSAKTGTTSIQQHLHEHADRFAANGYFVPPGVHAELPLSLLNEQHRKQGIAWPTFWPAIHESADAIWLRYFRQIEGSGCGNIVLSAENFCDLVDFMNVSGGDPFKATLDHYLSGYVVKVVAYLRPVADHVSSMYKELIKNGPEIRSGENLLCLMHKQQSTHFFPTKYLDYFSGLFGREALLLRRYDRSDFPRGDVVCDFLKTIAYPEPDAAGRKVLHENMSIPDDHVQLKRLFNVVGIEDVALNQLVSKYLIRSNSVSSTGEPRRECSYQTLDQAIEAETARIRDKYALDLGSDSGIRNLDAVTTSQAENFLIAMLAHVVSQNERLASRLDSIEQKLAATPPNLQPAPPERR